MELEIESLWVADDDRGLLCEPITAAELPTQRNAHLVLTRPGGVRGNHYHERSTEVMTVVGPALVRLRDGRGIRDISVADRQAMKFTLPPGVAHAVLNTGNTTGVIVSFTTLPHSRTQPDQVREVLIDSGRPQ